MTNKQFILGYRLSHAEGTKSRWQFVNDNDIILTIAIKLNNGSRYHFSEEIDYVYNWAANRGLKAETCKFEVCTNGEHLEFKFVG